MNIDKLVEYYYDKLNETDVYIWQYIYHNKEKCRKMTVESLASECNVSKTHIMRFAQKLGLDGYSELKFYIKLSLDSIPKFDSSTVFNVTSEIYKTANYLEKTDLTDILKKINNSHRIFIYVTGEVQMLMAMEIKRQFTYVNKIVHIIEDNSEINILENSLTKEDMMFIISFDGDNPFAIKWANQFRNRDIYVLGIANDSNNLLRKNSDYFIGFTSSKLNTGITDTSLRCTAHLFIIADMLIIKFLEYINNV